MNAIFRIIPSFALGLAIAAGDCLAAPTPAGQYKALLKEFNSASGGQRTAKTDLQRKAAAIKELESSTSSN